MSEQEKKPRAKVYRALPPTPADPENWEWEDMDGKWVPRTAKNYEVKQQ